MKFDIDPGYIFRLLLQFHSRKLNTMYTECNQSAEGAAGLGITRDNKLGESE